MGILYFRHGYGFPRRPSIADQRITALAPAGPGGRAFAEGDWGRVAPAAESRPCARLSHLCAYGSS